MPTDIDAIHNNKISKSSDERPVIVDNHSDVMNSDSSNKQFAIAEVHREPESPEQIELENLTYSNQGYKNTEGPVMAC